MRGYGSGLKIHQWL